MTENFPVAGRCELSAVGFVCWLVALSSQQHASIAQGRICSDDFTYFNTLRPIWRSTAVSLRNKIRITNTNVKSGLLYSLETWRVTKTSTHKLQTFTSRCFRNIPYIRWPGVVSNEQLWDKTKQTPIETEIRKRKWGWIGHTLRKPASNITRQALDWNPQGKRKIGRPKQTWRRSTDAEIKAAGTTWAELKTTRQNRVRWRGVVAALSSTRNQEA